MKPLESREEIQGVLEKRFLQPQQQGSGYSARTVLVPRQYACDTASLALDAKRIVYSRLPMFGELSDNWWLCQEELTLVQEFLSSKGFFRELAKLTAWLNSERFLCLFATQLRKSRSKWIKTERYAYIELASGETLCFNLVDDLVVLVTDKHFVNDVVYSHTRVTLAVAREHGDAMTAMHVHEAVTLLRKRIYSPKKAEKAEEGHPSDLSIE